MKNKINILDLFSGIGGFSKGLLESGFEIENHYFSEVDKHAIACYKQNFKNSIYVGSVDTIQPRELGRIDIITFGSPCQDFSLAGKRKGLEGQRSSLILHAIKLISELRPGVFIWENVKGAFSSNDGADFWAIIQAFANIGGYRLEWQLLNTVWFLPQNRERIYLIGHLATTGGSFRPVFPIGEEVELHHKTEQEKPSQIASTLNANDEKRWVGNFIQVNSATSKGYEVATPGDSINLSNPNSKTRRGRVGKGVAQTIDTQANQGVMIGAFRGRKAGLSTKQTLEINENGTLNALTSVQKDNVVVGTWRTHKDGQGFRKVQDGNCPTIPARAREDGSVQPVIDTQNSIRRLTEIECERLQGFPQQRIFICLEKIKNHAQNVEVKCHKLQKFVLTVEKIELSLNALFAQQNLSIKPAQKNKLVRENVHINFGENGVEIHNQGKIIFSAKNAESENWFHPLIKIEDFALLLVRTNLILEKTMLIGKVELQAKEQALIHQKNLKKFVKKYGKGITLPVKDVEKDLITLNLLLKYTTSYHLNTGKDDLILRTWFSFVIHAITGLIPEEIQIVNLSSLSLSIDHGWTQFGNYDGEIKEVPKTQRYKMLGNAVTVKVVKEIGIKLKNNLK